MSRRVKVTGEGGETLIELLVAMVVIGLGVTAVLGALTAAVDVSTMNRGQAQARAALGSWAESLTSVDDTGAYHYTSCATPGSFPAATGLPTGFAASVESVRYWNGTSWSGSCGTDQGLQKVRLTVSAPATLLPGFAQSVDVVVRRPCAIALSDPGSC
jgi:type II secretory pathway pseudopilin PulG